MFAHDELRALTSGGYTGRREYILENHLLQKRAEMQVAVTCDRNGAKHFQVISERGWRAANKLVLRKMLEAEAASSQPDVRPKSRITADNYTFRMMGTDTPERRTAYVIEVTPKRQDKALFRGRIWVDAEDYALARIEGQTAKSPSFWIRRIRFVRDYYKCGQLWFPMETTSVTATRIFGKTNVTIRYLDYQTVPETPATPPGPSMLEAESAGR
jgi:hypothetical protein